MSKDMRVNQYNIILSDILLFKIIYITFHNL